jgi:CrcB protein
MLNRTAIALPLVKPTPRILLLTFVGGALGTALRFGLSFEVADTLVVLFIVNLLGAAALGWFNGDRRFDTDERRALWSVGFAGGFTTMSGVALFLANGAFFSPNSTIFWVALMFAFGLAAYWLALTVAKRVVAK